MNTIITKRLTRSKPHDIIMKKPKGCVKMNKNRIFLVGMFAVSVLLFLLRMTGLTAHIAVSVVGVGVAVVFATTVVGVGIAVVFITAVGVGITVITVICIGGVITLVTHY